MISVFKWGLIGWWALLSCVALHDAIDAKPRKVSSPTTRFVMMLVLILQYVAYFALWRMAFP